MKDLFQMLTDAFPMIARHPQISTITALCLVGLASFYKAKESRKHWCHKWSCKLYMKIATTSRWLYVYQNSTNVKEWKYYTSETSGKGQTGDDHIWRLVRWPDFKPLDSFTVQGAVGMVDGIYQSRARLEGRWNIVHDPDSLGIGPLPARGIRSKIRQSLAKMLLKIGSL